MVSDIKIYREILNSHSKGDPMALVTIVQTKGSTPGKTGFKMLVFLDGKTLGTVGGGQNEAGIISQAIKVIETSKSKLTTFEYEGSDVGSKEPICGGSCEIFIEPILPQLTLYIFGAGHVGQSLAKIGKIIGFRIVVIDDREEFANKERFPDADEILVADFNKVKEKLKFSKRSCFIIATHGHKNDLEALRSFIESDLLYIGMIGSKRKVKEIFESLKRDGISKRLLERVHAPIGLSIGAETPAEIAISIMAEIISEIRTEKH